jgi:hypothetical protein
MRNGKGAIIEVLEAEEQRRGPSFRHTVLGM